MSGHDATAQVDGKAGEFGADSPGDLSGCNFNANDRESGTMRRIRADERNANERE